MRPVAATVWLKDAWMRPGLRVDQRGQGVDVGALELLRPRGTRGSSRGSSCTRASSSSTSSAVEAARVLAVFFPLLRPSRSNRISRSWMGELMLNSPLARTWISRVRACELALHVARSCGRAGGRRSSLPRAPCRRARGTRGSSISSKMGSRPSVSRRSRHGRGQAQDGRGGLGGRLRRGGQGCVLSGHRPPCPRRAARRGTRGRGRRASRRAGPGSRGRRPRWRRRSGPRSRCPRARTAPGRACRGRRASGSSGPPGPGGAATARPGRPGARAPRGGSGRGECRPPPAGFRGHGEAEQARLHGLVRGGEHGQGHAAFGGGRRREDLAPPRGRTGCAGTRRPWGRLGRELTGKFRNSSSLKSAKACWRRSGS